MSKQDANIFTTVVLTWDAFQNVLIVLNIHSIP